MSNYLASFACVGLLILGLGGCFGPDPVVVRSQLQAPTAPDQPHHLVITLQNRGGGEGGVDVIARLRARATGETVAQANQEVDLTAHEMLTTTLDIEPSGPGPYDISVEVRYPPN